jgi:hypothetical protein
MILTRSCSRNPARIDVQGSPWRIGSPLPVHPKALRQPTGQSTFGGWMALGRRDGFRTTSEAEHA